MLFNLHVFLFLFLPAVFAVYWLTTTFISAKWARRWSLVASLFFFAWWHPPDLLVLFASLIGNYVIGRALFVRPARSAAWLLRLGVALNLLLLGCFKYSALALATVHWFSGATFAQSEIVLPLAISFFTFNQIAYLVDCHRGEGALYAFDDYCLFITFFPHLIAGPIVHHREMVPQLLALRRFDPILVAQGLTLFVMGLGKKVIFADNVATYAKAVFSQAALGLSPTFLDSWVGALAYTTQLYFDFSGYSDMAIGLGMMFGVIFPLNFASPYRAANIGEFWRRWHITLSRFLRDYLYIPLGGNRINRVRTSVNLMLTMLIGGLWHGAGWTFVAWGGLHGLMLLVQQRFSAAIARTRVAECLSRGVGYAVCWALTFSGVVFGWVLFRSDTLGTALRLWKGMLGLNGVTLEERHLSFVSRFGIDPVNFSISRGQLIVNPTLEVAAWIVGLLAVSVMLPNSQQFIGSKFGVWRAVTPLPRCIGAFQWRPTLAWGLATAAIAIAAVLHITRLSEFLYFQFGDVFFA